MSKTLHRDLKDTLFDDHNHDDGDVLCNAMSGKSWIVLCHEKEVEEL